MGSGSCIFTVTQKSPELFRFAFTERLRNASLNAREYLIRANESPLAKKQPALYAERVSYQRKAMTELILIGYLAVMPWSRIAFSESSASISPALLPTAGIFWGGMSCDKKRFRGEAVPGQDPAPVIAPV
ncbi:MAG: hypothetical protein VZR11_09170 [Succinimonas sp.]|nr:hypothetical protein [Succinimonas sp.]